MDTKIYIFSLDYGNRCTEREFVKEMLRNFDENSLTGCGIFVNNNPYRLDLLLYVSVLDGIERFEDFIKQKFGYKRRVFNYFMEDIINTLIQSGYNFVTFLDEESVDRVMTEESNSVFLFPDKKILENIWGGVETKKVSRVFLSHSSKDKKIIDDIFNVFQINEISAWYDKYEIEVGDSITEKINQGLDESDIGIICISKNFLDSNSGWAQGELNYFIQRRMRNPDKYFIIVNIDVPYDELPPLVQDYKYIDFAKDDAMEILVDTLKKRLLQK